MAKLAEDYDCGTLLFHSGLVDRDEANKWPVRGSNMSHDEAEERWDKSAHESLEGKED
jgi:hypothetical protein